MKIFETFFNLSKVEAGKLELNPSPVQIRDLLENSLLMIKEKALKHCIQVTTDLNSIPQTINADERKLKQILYNLLSNAVKFTPEKGNVALSAKFIQNSDLKTQNMKSSATNYLQISVEDSGIGIKKADVKRIIEPFEQAENSASREYQGTGLGLSLTKSLVELHGGKIWAESGGEGQGAKFIFTLPISDGV